MRLGVAVALDGPEAEATAATVVEQAAVWAVRTQGVLDLLFVEGPDYATQWIADATVRAMVEQEARVLRAERRARLDALLGAIPEGHQGIVEVLAGDAVEALVEVGTRYDALLLATHGRQGLDRLWSGSTAEQVVRRAPCPVLVMRLPAASA